VSGLILTPIDIIINLMFQLLYLNCGEDGAKGSQA
jgi:hypothetical protein